MTSVCWLIRWDGPFAVSYMAKNQKAPKRLYRRRVRESVRRFPARTFKKGHPWTTMAAVGGAGPAFFVVNHPKQAFRFETKGQAESAALLIVAKDPEAMLGTTSVREWNGKKRYP